MNWVRRHFRKVQQLKPWPFCFRIASESFAVTLIAAIPIGLIVQQPRQALFDLPLEVVLIAALLAAPVLETLVAQALPILIARRLRAAIGLQVGISVALFAILHLGEGVATMLAAGMVGGFYFAFTFAHWARRSAWTAMWTTATVHLLHNTLTMAIIVSCALMAGGWPGSIALHGLPVDSPQLNGWIFSTRGRAAFAIIYTQATRARDTGGVGHSSWGSDHYPHCLVHVRGPFKIQMLGQYRPIRYDVWEQAVAIDGKTYALADGRLFLVGSDRSGLTIEQRLDPHEPADINARYDDIDMNGAIRSVFADLVAAAEPASVRRAR